MILTVTPNPTIDRIVFVRNFRLGAIVRGEREIVTPSGKGVDSSLVIHELGGATLALGLNAGHSGYLLTKMLDDWKIPHDFVPASGETRTAIVLVDEAVNRQSTISAPTLTATEEDFSRLLAQLARHATRTWGVICAGSLPPGLPPDSYAQLIRQARQHELVTLLDTSGEALRQGVAGPPHILKINQQELRQLAPGLVRNVHPDTEQGGQQADIPTTADVVELAQRLIDRLREWASDALIITLGSRGTLAVTTEGCYYARPPEVPVVNTAGAGDALNGGILLARGRGDDWPAALALATAAAASTVMHEGTAICYREEVDELLPQVQVSQID